MFIGRRIPAAPPKHHILVRRICRQIASAGIKTYGIRLPGHQYEVPLLVSVNRGDASEEDAGEEGGKKSFHAGKNESETHF
jgi:hypothetical protein